MKERWRVTYQSWQMELDTEGKFVTDARASDESLGTGMIGRSIDEVRRWATQFPGMKIEKVEL